MMSMLDDKDRLLIHELQKNGRKPLLQIAKKANISHVALKKRLTNLIEKGFLSIRANVNLEKIIFVLFSEEDFEIYRKVIREILKND